MEFTNNEKWDWEGGDFCLQKTSDYNASHSVYEDTQNEEDLSYMFDDTTPVKSCWEFGYQTTQDDIGKETTRCSETSSQIKRRRMLQFEDQMMDSPFCNEKMSYSFFKSTSEDSVEEIIPGESQWVSEFSDNASSYNHKDLSQSSEGWLAECFSCNETTFPDDTTFSEASDTQIDITELCNASSEVEVNMVQRNVNRNPRKLVLKGGRKSYIRTPMKLATSSVTYPFDFIKPSGACGDVTLNDINQRIRTPPPKLKQKNEDTAYPTSAITGKPVVGKTKIRTEGGKGSITIMRTKG